jgi:hypothetical protein
MPIDDKNPAPGPAPAAAPTPAAVPAPAAVAAPAVAARAPKQLSRSELEALRRELQRKYH